jgi:outer membrane protein W
LVLVVFLLSGSPALAQEWRLDANQFTFGLGYFVPSGGVNNVDLKASMAFNLDYRYFFLNGFTLGSTFSYTSMEATTKLFAPPHAQVTTNYPLYSFTGFVGYQFNQGKRVEPYVGAGLNLMTSVTDINKTLYTGAGSGGVYQLTPLGGTSLGAAVMAGLDIKIKNFWFLNVDVRYLDNDLKMQRWSYGGRPYSWYKVGDYKLKVQPMTYSVNFGFRW